MPVNAWFQRSRQISAAPAVHRLEVMQEQWRQVALDIAAAGGRLLALWAGDGLAVHAAFLITRGVLIMTLRLQDTAQRYPGLEDIFPAASRMQRAIVDLSGLRSTDPDTRPWLRHSAWPEVFHPLRAEPSEEWRDDESRAEPYAFVRVDGEGVHEIPVGPVHAGTIEPGHFRFSVVGEKVLRLEERLGYVHKGIEYQFARLPVLEAHRLAAHISGDSAAAFSWAYCQALETASHLQLPPRALALRALHLEIERIANHLGDLGALGNDAGFALGLAQFSRLKEQMLRASAAALGQRYFMEAIVPGGTRVDLATPGATQLVACVQSIAREAAVLREIYEEHEGVRDRFTAAGIVAPELASRLGLIGLAGRASDQAFDLRVDLPCAPYEQLTPTKIVRREGDVAARVAVRFDELVESCRLVERILDALPAGAHCIEPIVPEDGAFGCGLIEGWRGPVLVALEAGPGGSIRRCHPHDPSWQNWPALEHAIIGNIVPDFPLINKSFNLSYSGHDL